MSTLAMECPQRIRIGFGSLRSAMNDLMSIAPVYKLA